METQDHICPCPSLDALAAYLERTLPGEKYQEVESHLDGCRDCRFVLCTSGVAGTTDSQADAQDNPVARPPRMRVWFASTAAAGVLLAGVALAAVALHSAWFDDASAVESGSFLAAAEGTGSVFATGENVSAPDGGLALLSDGSLLTLDPGTTLRLDPPMPGERARVRLLCGGTLFDVTNTPVGFRVDTDLGTVRVRGTRFEVRLHPSRLDAPPCTEVLVHEGAVEAANAMGAVVLRASEGTFLFPDLLPGRHIWDPGVPGAARSAADLLGTLLAETSTANDLRIQMLLSYLARAQVHGIPEVESRVREEERSIEDRLRWVAVLRAIGTREALEAMDRIASECTDLPGLIEALGAATK